MTTSLTIRRTVTSSMIKPGIVDVDVAVVGVSVILVAGVSVVGSIEGCVEAEASASSAVDMILRADSDGLPGLPGTDLSEFFLLK